MSNSFNRKYKYLGDIAQRSVIDIEEKEIDYFPDWGEYPITKDIIKFDVLRLSRGLLEGQTPIIGYPTLKYDAKTWYYKNRPFSRGRFKNGKFCICHLPEYIGMQGRGVNEKFSIDNNPIRVTTETRQGKMLILDACLCGGDFGRDERGYIICLKCGLIYNEFIKEKIDVKDNFDPYLKRPVQAVYTVGGDWRRLIVSDYIDNINGEFGSCPKSNWYIGESNIREPSPMTDELRASIIATKKRVFPNSPEKWFVNYPGEPDINGNIQS